MSSSGLTQQIVHVGINTVGNTSYRETSPKGNMMNIVIVNANVSILHGGMSQGKPQTMSSVEHKEAS